MAKSRFLRQISNQLSYFSDYFFKYFAVQKNVDRNATSTDMGSFNDTHDRHLNFELSNPKKQNPITIQSELAIS